MLVCVLGYTLGAKDLVRGGGRGSIDVLQLDHFDDTVITSHYNSVAGAAIASDLCSRYVSNLMTRSTSERGLSAEYTVISLSAGSLFLHGYMAIYFLAVFFMYQY